MEDKIKKPKSVSWPGVYFIVVVIALIDVGDDLNRPNGSYGGTPLLLGAQAPENSREIVMNLIASGADVNKSNSFGVNPFIAFAGVFDVEVTRLALEHDADINSQSQAGSVRVNKSSFGTTALMNAAKVGKIETIRLLLQHGADASLVDSKTKNATDYASENGHHEIAELLSKAKKQ